MIAGNPTYLNPVYPKSFPDPFVLKYCGEYWSYCTGIQADGRCFGILHSEDLVHWETLNGAMEPLPGGQTMYWAPEVFFYNGRFYLYYSTGNETLMEIRVAVADQPRGPFVDSGRTLTSQNFAIDAHVFQDDDGSIYLFYATDFLNYSRVGTGTVMDRLVDPFTLEGEPCPVTRARYDWQIYDSKRAEKGGVRWHTIEGSFVLKHKDLYYQMFSGGNWTNPSYGVGYAINDSLARHDEWTQASDGVKVLPVLRTIPGKVIGPGHNSVVRGPDNRQLYCVYHRWAEDGSARQMAIDPLDWAGERLLVLGPSFTPQFFPILPTASGFEKPAEGKNSGLGWTFLSGEWQMQDNGKVAIQNRSTGLAEASFKLPTKYFLAEISLKCSDPDSEGYFGISLYGEENARFGIFIEPKAGQIRLSLQQNPGSKEQVYPLYPDFNPLVFHLLRLEVQDLKLTLSVDQVPLGGLQKLAGEIDTLQLTCQSAAAAFTGFALTPGWEDLFLGDRAAALAGWQIREGKLDRLKVSLGELHLEPGSQPVFLTKGDYLQNYELCVNVRLHEMGEHVAPTFYPVWSEQEKGPALTLGWENLSGWVLQVNYSQCLALPDNFDPSIYQQFRFRKWNQNLIISWENNYLGELKVSGEATKVGLYLPSGGIAFDMVRVTAL